MTVLAHPSSGRRHSPSPTRASYPSAPASSSPSRTAPICRRPHHQHLRPHHLHYHHAKRPHPHHKHSHRSLEKPIHPAHPSYVRGVSIPRASSFTRSKRIISGSALSAHEALGLLDQPCLNPSSTDSAPSLARFTLARIALSRAFRHPSLSTSPPPPPPLPTLSSSMISSVQPNTNFRRNLAAIYDSKHSETTSNSLDDANATPNFSPPPAPPFPPSWHRLKVASVRAQPVAHTADVYPPWPVSTYLPRTTSADPSDPAGSSEGSTSSSQEPMLSADDLQGQYSPDNSSLFLTSASTPPPPLPSAFVSSPCAPTLCPRTLPARAFQLSPDDNQNCSPSIPYNRVRCHTVLHDFPFSRPSEHDSSLVSESEPEPTPELVREPLQELPVHETDDELGDEPIQDIDVEPVFELPHEVGSKQPANVDSVPDPPGHIESPQHQSFGQLTHQHHGERDVSPLGHQSSDGSTGTVIVHNISSSIGDLDHSSANISQSPKNSKSTDNSRVRKSRSSSQTNGRSVRVSLPQRLRGAGEKLIAVIPRGSSLTRIRPQLRSRNASRSPPRNRTRRRPPPPSTTLPLVSPESMISSHTMAQSPHEPLHSPERTRGRRNWGRRRGLAREVSDPVDADIDLVSRDPSASCGGHTEERDQENPPLTPPVTPPSSPPPSTPNSTREDGGPLPANELDDLPLPPSLALLPSSPDAPTTRAHRNEQPNDGHENQGSSACIPPAAKCSDTSQDRGFVTIRRVVRRVLADGSEEVVTYNVQVKAERVLGNGDVVVKRKMRRAKDDGTGTELLTVMQVIPRAKDSPIPKEVEIVPPPLPAPAKSVTVAGTPQDATELPIAESSPKLDFEDGAYSGKSKDENSGVLPAIDSENYDNHDDVSTNLTSDSDGEDSGRGVQISDEADRRLDAAEKEEKRRFLAPGLVCNEDDDNDDDDDEDEDDDDGASSLPDILERTSRISDTMWGNADLRRRSSARSKTDLCPARPHVHARVIDAPSWEDRPAHGRSRPTTPGARLRYDGWRWGKSRVSVRKEEHLRKSDPETRSYTWTLRYSKARSPTGFQREPRVHAPNETHLRNDEREHAKRRNAIPRMLSFQSIWRRASSREPSPAPRRR